MHRNEAVVLLSKRARGSAPVPAHGRVGDANSGGGGGTKVQLSLEDIRELPLPLPDISVQIERIEKLEDRLEHLRILVKHAQEHIERLREYRSSLISAAVTGQLDISTFKEAN